MIVAAISDEANLRKLGRFKEITGRLSDPRKTNDGDAEKLIREGKVLYHATGAMHSPETGSPEMLMELAYRLAVEETPFIKDIRKNVVVLMTPVLETDGRDRVLDVINNKKKYPGLSPVYWGKYVAHDNNRDGMALALALTRNVMKTFLEYHPTVLHDLHESVPFLYTSTGTGPYNPWLDPIVIGEWHQLAYHEINEMAKRGVPGVWTHGFYDGWAPNYMLYIGNGHNAIGRFYETFGNSDPDTQDRTVTGQSQRDWFRPNPPLARVKWSLRNNVNMQQSALLLALHYSADHREEMLHNFYLKSKRAVAKASTEGPAAYVLPATDLRRGQQSALIKLLQLQGIEVHRTTAEMKVADGTYSAGSFVVRMDQPYSRLADCFLDTEFFNVADPSPYDDTGWTLGALYNVRTVRIVDLKALDTPMELLGQKLYETSGVVDNNQTMTHGYRFTMIIPNRGDAALLALRMRLKDVNFDATDEPIQMKNEVIPAGSLIVSEKNAAAGRQRIDEACKALGILGYAVLPVDPLTTKTHPVPAPRIALLHTWTSTQNEGWWRIGFDQFQIPYNYISVHTVRDTADLRSKWDVIILPPSVVSGQSLINGLSADKPVPWMKSAETPHLGTPDSSPDIRGGIGEKGKENLKRFVEEGGVFVAAASTVNAARDLGLAPGVSVDSGTALQARGSVMNAVVTDAASPVTYGFDRSLAVYFSSAPLLRIDGDNTPKSAAVSTATEVGGATGVQGRGGGRGGGQGRGQLNSQRASGRGTENDPDIIQARPNARRTPSADKQNRLSNVFDHNAITLPEWALKSTTSTGPRVLLRFAAKENLLVSGMLAGGEALEGRPAVVDVPVGKGHTLLFAINPMWRSETQGSYPLLFNACLNAGALGVGR
jgi:hypothetical protein